MSSKTCVIVTGSGVDSARGLISGSAVPVGQRASISSRKSKSSLDIDIAKGLSFLRF